MQSEETDHFVDEEPSAPLLLGKEANTRDPQRAPL